MFCFMALRPEPIALCMQGKSSITELHPKLRNVCSTTIVHNTDYAQPTHQVSRRKFIHFLMVPSSETSLVFVKDETERKLSLFCDSFAFSSGCSESWQASGTRETEREAVLMNLSGLLGWCLSFCQRLFSFWRCSAKASICVAQMRQPLVLHSPHSLLLRKTLMP